MNMNEDIPFVNINNDISFNLALVLLIISKFSKNKLGNYKLNFDKIQIIIYLIKNPSKINKFLEASDRKIVDIEEEQLHAVESLSLNVDVLFNREKLKSILEVLMKKGLVSVVNDEKNGFSYCLLDNGCEFVNELNGGYFKIIKSHLDALSPLQSMSSNKLFSNISVIFKGR